jgi:hypothetical protein
MAPFFGQYCVPTPSFPHFGHVVFLPLYGGNLGLGSGSDGFAFCRKGFHIALPLISVTQGAASAATNSQASVCPYRVPSRSLS